MTRRVGVGSPLAISVLVEPEFRRTLTSPPPLGPSTGSRTILQQRVRHFTGGSRIDRYPTFGSAISLPPRPPDLRRLGVEIEPR